MKKVRPIIRKWFDQFINKTVMWKKSKISRDKSKDQIINDIWRLVDTEKKRRKKEEAK